MRHQHASVQILYLLTTYYLLLTTYYLLLTTYYQVRHQHASVQILYLELLVRYHRVLLATPALLGAAFQVLTLTRTLILTRGANPSSRC